MREKSQQKSALVPDRIEHDGQRARRMAPARIVGMQAGEFGARVGHHADEAAGLHMRCRHVFREEREPQPDSAAFSIW